VPPFADASALEPPLAEVALPPVEVVPPLERLPPSALPAELIAGFELPQALHVATTSAMGANRRPRDPSSSPNIRFLLDSTGSTHLW
jgi:hypothetical protein